MNGGLPVNRFAHKHIGQLRECAAWPKTRAGIVKTWKEEGEERKKKLNHDGNRLQKLFISLLFYVFLVLTVHPSLSPVSRFHSHSFLLAHSTLFCISQTPPPPTLHLTTFKTTLLSSVPLSLSFSSLHSRPPLTT